MEGQVRTRQTQEERRKRTRGRILDATVGCLVELGFARTSTNEVQKRSGVSRGALLHHFPSKNELLVSAIQHLASMRYREMRERLEGFSSGQARLSEAIELLWECFSDPLFYVAMELRTAARTDEGLRVALIQTELELRRGLFSLSGQLFGEELTSQSGFPAALDLMIQSMIGTAMTALLHRDEARIMLLVERWKTLLVQMTEDKADE